MNEFDEVKVAYETEPKETPLKKKDENKQFPGNKMPQGNKNARGGEFVEQTYPANPSLNRHGEYR